MVSLSSTRARDVYICRNEGDGEKRNNPPRRAADGRQRWSKSTRSCQRGKQRFGHQVAITTSAAQSKARYGLTLRPEAIGDRIRVYSTAQLIDQRQD